MWTHLASWLVKSGEVSQLELGDTFRDVSVRASSWSFTDAQGPDGLDLRPGPDPTGEPSLHYAITGEVAWRREPGSMLVQVGDLAFVVEPREGAVPVDRLPEVGERVTALATLDVMGTYEIDAFDYPDVRRDWLVRGLKVEHRELVTSPTFPDTREPGHILRIDDIPQMLRWADATSRDHATYVLDLEPLTAPTG
ncbi:hypothetical protein [Nocardioides cynanchi]|uniref:hypothetical protein n=1 Tax=Nocardioides cynanchi TaxID=2558918 RepID=UPI001248A43D|nr:hypothetical protein [Nocardioides cynanchi]